MLPVKPRSDGKHIGFSKSIQNEIGSNGHETEKREDDVDGRRRDIKKYICYIRKY